MKDAPGQARIAAIGRGFSKDMARFLLSLCEEPRSDTVQIGSVIGPFLTWEVPISCSYSPAAAAERTPEALDVGGGDVCAKGRGMVVTMDCAG